jgi:hypothetical protein
VVLYATDLAGNRDSDEVTVIVNDVEPPVADAGHPVHGEPQIPVRLYGGRSTDDFGIVDYEWTIDIHGVTSVVHGETVEFTFNATGEFWVVLRVYDFSGNWDEDEVNVTLTDYRPPVARAGEDQEVYANTSFTLNGTASADNVGVVNWTWSVVLYDGNVSVLFGPTPNMTLTVPGLYQVMLEVRDAAGWEDDDVVVIEVLGGSPPEEPGTGDGDEIPSFTRLQLIFLVLVVLVFVVVILLNAYGGGGEIRI